MSQHSDSLVSPNTSVFLALIWGVPVAVVCTVAFVLNWGR